MAMTTCRQCSRAVATDAPTCPKCGTTDPGEGGAERDAARKAESDAFGRKFSLGCGGLIVAVILVSVLASLGGDDSGEDGGDSGAALVACKRAVAAKLANPATADFETLATSLVETAAGFEISGPMKAKTGFGVEQDLRYRCTTTKSGTVLTAAVR